MADDEKKTSGASPGGDNSQTETPPAATTPGEKPGDETPKKTVEVEADVLKQIMDGQTAMQEQIDELTKSNKDLVEDNKILRESVSQGRLGQAEEKRKVKELVRAHLKRMNGKVIVGWESYPKNQVVKNPSTGRVVGEVLKAKYFFLGGGDTGFIDQVEFTDSTDLVYIRIKKDMGEKIVVEFEDKSVYPDLLEISKDFINP